MPSALICVNCLLLLASIVAFISADTLTAEYDFEEKRIRFYDLKQAFTLVCHLKQSTKTSKTPDIDWYKKDDNDQSLRKVSDIESFKDRHVIESDDDDDDDDDDDERNGGGAASAAGGGGSVSRTYKLTVQKGYLTDAGTYFCKVDSDDDDNDDNDDDDHRNKNDDDDHNGHKDSNKKSSKRSENSADKNLKAEIRVFSNPYVKMLLHDRAIEGESKKLNCTIMYNSVGLQVPPIVRWKVGDQFVNESSTSGDNNHFVFIEDNQNLTSALQIQSANMSDANTYECIVTLQIDDISRTKNATTQLFVKDKYAAVWPFLGICIEVAVLLLVIFIFEKRRNKTEIVESDSEQMPEQQSYASDTAVKESKETPTEIRQRNK